MSQHIEGKWHIRTYITWNKVILDSSDRWHGLSPVQCQAFSCWIIMIHCKSNDDEHICVTVSKTSILNPSGADGFQLYYCKNAIGLWYIFHIFKKLVDSYGCVYLWIMINIGVATVLCSECLKLLGISGVANWVTFRLPTLQSVNVFSL